jgi:hypothetical protein
MNFVQRALEHGGSIKPHIDGDGIVQDGTDWERPINS